MPLIRRIFLLLILVSFSVVSQTASYSIFGMVQDKKDASFLQSATIHLENINNGNVVAYTISNNNGYFSLEGTSNKKALQLYISAVGFKTYSKKTTISQTSINLGGI